MAREAAVAAPPPFSPCVYAFVMTNIFRAIVTFIWLPRVNFVVVSRSCSSLFFIFFHFSTSPKYYYSIFFCTEILRTFVRLFFILIGYTHSHTLGEIVRRKEYNLCFILLRFVFGTNQENTRTNFHNWNALTTTTTTAATMTTTMVIMTSITYYFLRKYSKSCSYFWNIDEVPLIPFSVGQNAINIIFILRLTFRALSPVCNTSFRLFATIQTRTNENDCKSVRKNTQRFHTWFASND